MMMMMMKKEIILAMIMNAERRNVLEIILHGGQLLVGVRMVGFSSLIFGGVVSTLCRIGPR